MLRKIMGFLFGLITTLSGMAFLAITLLQGQARIDKYITPPSNWVLLGVICSALFFGFLTLATWTKDKKRNNKLLRF